MHDIKYLYCQLVPPENCTQKWEHAEFITGNVPLIRENCAYVLRYNFDLDK